uniref:Uncharacterized protein n=1 Tax=Aureoumbra lagunensis TaxID=44058 RepID=A0A7S3K3G6_9STRA|mmetsp:Transcript_6037/g.8902  ORF Transcript_6037/g.8902 Transcript_6037/m.8902 type:complete len:935 (+) Transcript_6037:108-2912(+)|eukprot:CAMPEP_0197315176 /NCGR_PEP_ID=MMETSP0891-20130614/37091_1 /TAXON_ID=44058 ORGANISM="Aureoumbra lagunensis, Strain CCMP1510" /NCGR_SAMPLE_ID=MMETSP0891 /ASSEMBLY_ACC=CAM_ASM_000534 /LENGTH=934 /DNA_ID=CAMNT_0042804003 /DNA_START=33 /DNA_END=2837 /DNA_ORIENTATION=-
MSNGVEQIGSEVALLSTIDQDMQSVPEVNDVDDSLLFESSSDEDGKGENKKGLNHRISLLCCKTRLKKCFIYRESIAERLSFTPLRWLAMQPHIAGAITLISYTLFCLLWLAWAPLAFLLSEAGAWLVFIFLVRSGGGCIARFATFPGSFGSVRQDVEREYGRRVAARLEQAALVFESWWLCLHPRGGRPDEANIILEAFSAAKGVQLDSLIPLRDAMACVLPVKEKQTHEQKSTLLYGDLGQREISLSVQAIEAAEAVYQALVAVIDACEPLEAITQVLASQKDIGAARLALGQSPDSSRAIYTLASACRELARIVPYCLAPNSDTVSSLRRSSSQTRQRRADRQNTLRGRILCLASDLINTVKNVCRAPCPIPLDTSFGLSLMRAELVQRLGATQIWLGDVDCCIIPPHFERQSTTGILSVPTVLFCAPNAVLYESFSMASRESAGWVTTYARAGLQVVLWNPAGYGRRKGSPSPRRNLQDGTAIVTALLEAGVSSLLIHGESIGALAATGLAAYCCSLLNVFSNEDGTLTKLALVADRSFSNLAVEAQYLTGFKAAGPLLPLVTGWWPNEADSLAQFRRVTCPKLITCDAKDHMIPDPASLKAGLAIFSELGDARPRKLELTGSLALSDAQVIVPHGLNEDMVNNLLERAPNSLKDNELEFAFAAVRYVGRIAARRFSADFDEFNWQASVDLERGVYSDDTPRLRRSSSRRRNLSKGKNIAKQNRRRSHSPYPPEKNNLATFTDAEPLEICAWSILERVDGECGMSLGRVLACDFGTFRAWACSYVTWPNGSLRKLLDASPDLWLGADDSYFSDAEDEIESISVSEAAAKLRALIHSVQEDGNNDLLLVLRFIAAFLFMLDRRADFNTTNTESNQILGDLLVLGCGHNAPYSTAELDAFFAWLRTHFHDSLWPAASPSPPPSPETSLFSNG